MSVADWLEVVAQALSALLAVWLGLTVATRSRLPVARVFTFLALVVATWSSCIILQRLDASADATAVARSIEDLAAALAIGGLAHFALVDRDRRPPLAPAAGRGRRELRDPRGVRAPDHPPARDPVALDPPHFSLGPIPGAVLFWGWVAARLGRDRPRSRLAAPGHAQGGIAGPLKRRQLRAALATIGMAGLGASLRFLPVIGDADRWIGTSFITLAVVCAAYAVFAAGISSAPRWRRAPSGHGHRRRAAGRPDRRPVRDRDPELEPPGP